MAVEPSHRARRLHRSSRTIGTVLTAVTALIAMAACSHSSNAAQPATAANTPAASASAADSAQTDAAGRAAVAAYNAEQAFEVKAFATMDDNPAHYRKYATSPYADIIPFFAKQYRSAGVVYRGKPTWRATVTSVDLAASPPVVTLSVCLTRNGWQPVFKATGKPYISSAKDPAHELEIARITQQHGTWLLADAQAQEKPC